MEEDRNMLNNTYINGRAEFLLKLILIKQFLVCAVNALSQQQRQTVSVS